MINCNFVNNLLCNLEQHFDIGCDISGGANEFAVIILLLVGNLTIVFNGSDIKNDQSKYSYIIILLWIHFRIIKQLLLLQ